jgi:Glycosyl hydrolase-like 10
MSNPIEALLINFNSLVPKVMEGLHFPTLPFNLTPNKIHQILPKNFAFYLPGTNSLFSAEDSTANNSTSRSLRKQSIQNAIANTSPDGRIVINVLTARTGLLLKDNPASKVDVLDDLQQALKNRKQTRDINVWLEAPLLPSKNSSYGKTLLESGAALGIGQTLPNGSQDSRFKDIVYADPLHPEVIAMVRNSVTAASRRSGVSTIWLDDQFAVPQEKLREALYSRYNAQIGDKTPEAQNRWLQGQMKQQFYAASNIVHGQGKKMGLSIIGTIEQAESSGKNPLLWIRDGKVNYLEAQIYRKNGEDFKKTLNHLEYRINKDTETFRKLNELRIVISGFANGHNLTQEDKISQITQFNDFSKRMSALGIRTRLSIFEAANKKYF